MDIHGFAKAETFQVIEKTSNTLLLELTDNAVTYEQYPRHFSFRIRYALEGNTLKIEFHVENRDKKPMYYGVGGHPGFNVPLVAGRKFEDYRLRFHTPARPDRVGFTAACFLDGSRAPYALAGDTDIPLSHDLFNADAIVLTGMARSVTLETDGDPHSVTVSFPKMDYLGIWHAPHTDAPYVCIEPWTSLPSSKDQIAIFAQQKDLRCLAPGMSETIPWEITVT